MNNTADFLEEIAAVMRERPEDGYKVFEHDLRGMAEWVRYGGWNCLVYDATNTPNHVRRRRPRTITIAGIDVPEPMREALEEGADYWVTSPESILLVCSERWHGQWVDYQYLEKGLIHADKESAQQHARALILASGGEIEE